MSSSQTRSIGVAAGLLAVVLLIVSWATLLHGLWVKSAALTTIGLAHAGAALVLLCRRDP